MNQKALKQADDQFYKNHPEFVDKVTGARTPLKMSDDKALRDEWWKDYKAADEASKKGLSVCVVGGVLVVCPPPCAARASQTPTITTLKGPTDTGCGGFDWRIYWGLPTAAGQDGWVIQEINATFDIMDGSDKPILHKTLHFWEAWPVEKREKDHSSSGQHCHWI